MLLSFLELTQEISSLMVQAMNCTHAHTSLIISTTREMVG